MRPMLQEQWAQNSRLCSREPLQTDLSQNIEDALKEIQIFHLSTLDPVPELARVQVRVVVRASPSV